MGRNTKRIVIGRHVTIEEPITQAVISAVEKRRMAAFAVASPRLRERARAEAPVYQGDDPRATPGALMASVESGLSEKRKAIYLAAGGPGARHAHLVEYGTVKMRANPFMRRSIAKERKALLEDLKRELGKTPLVEVG